MEKQEIIKIIQEAKATRFVINNRTKARLFVTSEGVIAEYLPHSKRKGRRLDDDFTALWNTLKPEKAENKFSREVSNCINLMFNPPAYSRTLDNFFENGEYTEKLVQEIKKRAQKNKRLHDLLVKQYPTILTA